MEQVKIVNTPTTTQIKHKEANSMHLHQSNSSSDT